MPTELTDQEPYAPDADLTLAEIAEKDQGMLQDAIKGAARHVFNHEDKADAFKDWAIHKGLHHVGFNYHPGMDHRMIDLSMKKLKIRIESRPYPFKTGSEVWKNGTYIYKGDQLAVFVSDVMPVVTRNTPLRVPATPEGTLINRIESETMDVGGGKVTVPSVIHLLRPAEKYAVVTNAPGV
jgi:hypothetical protein